MSGFLLTMPVYLVVDRTASGLSPTTIPTDEYGRVVELFTEELHAERASDEYANAAKLLALTTHNELDDLLALLQSQGISHVAIDPGPKTTIIAIDRLRRSCGGESQFPGQGN